MRTRTEARPVDRLIEAYVEWREACPIVEDAYASRWRTARPGAATAFRRYRAALDAEEQAAEVYARMFRWVGGLLAAGTRTFPEVAA
jgi:hypothetical protein